MSIAVSLFGRSVARGETARFRAPVAEMNDGAPVSVAVMVVAGRRDGPTVLLSGAIHGDEYNGPAAIQRLCNEIPPDRLKGTLIGIPVMSPFSFYTRSRSNELDYEHLNLNRIWPGDPQGFLSQKAAHQIFRNAVEPANYVLDFHEGGIAFIAEYLMTSGSQSTRAKIGAMQNKMARWFGQGVPVVDKGIDDAAARLGRLGTMTEAAGSTGRPVLTIETGGGGTIWPRYVEMAVTGARRILTGLGLLEGEVPDDPTPQIVVADSFWPRPDRGGFMIPAPGVAMHAKLKAGAPLCHIHDLFGAVVDTVVAPFDCVILDTRHIATVYPGDWTYHCGKL